MLYYYQHNTYGIINFSNSADFLKVPVWVAGVLDGVGLIVGGLLVDQELGIDILWRQTQSSHTIFPKPVVVHWNKNSTIKDQRS